MVESIRLKSARLPLGANRALLTAAMAAGKSCHQHQVAAVDCRVEYCGDRYRATTHHEIRILDPILCELESISIMRSTAILVSV